jgi:hypothetical protein
MHRDYLANQVRQEITNLSEIKEKDIIYLTLTPIKGEYKSAFTPGQVTSEINAYNKAVGLRGGRKLSQSCSFCDNVSREVVFTFTVDEIRTRNRRARCTLTERIVSGSGSKNNELAQIIGHFATLGYSYSLSKRIAQVSESTPITSEFIKSA